MNASLVLLKKNGSQKAFPLPGSVTVVGRRHDCDLRIPLPTVSRKHCRLNLNNESLEIRDLDSTWGTFVNGQRVNGQAALKPGDTIRIGPLTFVCRIDGKPEKITPPPEAPKPQKAVASAANDALEDSFADLDVSDSFIEIDESDSELDDLKDL